MIPFTLKNLLTGIDLIETLGFMSRKITGLSYDSRSARRGDMFFALSGYKVDGHRYIDSAVEKGASAVIQEKALPPESKATHIRVEDSRKAMALTASNYYLHPSKKLHLIGVTGTDGKTTTCRLIHSILTAYGVVGILGTAGHKILGQEIKAERTTPEAPDINRLLAKLVNGGAYSTVMEVSSHALVLQRTYGLDFRLKVFTNLGSDHLDFHKDREDYFRAKAMLFYQSAENGCAVVNLDDKYGARLAKEIPGKVIGYSLKDPNVEVFGEIIGMNIDGIRMNVHYDNTIIDLNSPLIGIPNAYNILAAVASALQFNFTAEDIKQRIAAFSGVRGRFEKVDCGDFFALIDYAHTPDALENLLKTVRPLTQGKLHIVFGCGGDRDKRKRPLMGTAAEAGADCICITSDNPRSEKPEAIIEDILNGLKNKSAAKVIPDRRTAIANALNSAGKGDIVVLAGKGHEDYQEIAGEFHHFDDREEVIRWLEEVKK